MDAGTLKLLVAIVLYLTLEYTRLGKEASQKPCINVGRFTTRHEAEKMLLQTALVELGTLDELCQRHSGAWLRASTASYFGEALVADVFSDGGMDQLFSGEVQG